MTTPSPHDQLLAAQTAALDAIETLTFALQGKVIIAFGVQMMDMGPVIGLVPQCSIVLVEDGEQRAIVLKPPQHPPFIPALLVLAAQLVADRMGRQHQESGQHGEWMKRRHAITEMREASKKRILLPGRN